MRKKTVILLLQALWLLTSCGHPDVKENDPVTACTLLEELSVTKRAPQKGEWLERYPQQQQTFDEYLDQDPPRATAQREKLYIVTIGDFDEKGRSILRKAQEYLSAYYQIPIDTLLSIPLSEVDKKKTRKSDYGLQLHSEYIIDELLPRHLPDSAFALIAFTMYDLYPADDWNFVFGQASLNKRVGTWSLARLGDYHQNDSLYRLCLQRTLNIAAHETGHMLGIHHCVKYECCMNGSNSLWESDRQLPWLCWECLSKVCYNRQVMPLQQVLSLQRFNRNCLRDPKQEAYYTQAVSLLQRVP